MANLVNFAGLYYACIVVHCSYAYSKSYAYYNCSIRRDFMYSCIRIYICILVQLYRIA